MQLICKIHEKMMCGRPPSSLMYDASAWVFVFNPLALMSALIYTEILKSFFEKAEWAYWSDLIPGFYAGTFTFPHIVGGVLGEGNTRLLHGLQGVVTRISGIQKTENKIALLSGLVGWVFGVWYTNMVAQKAISYLTGIKNKYVRAGIEGVGLLMLIAPRMDELRQKFPLSFFNTTAYLTYSNKFRVNIISETN